MIKKNLFLFFLICTLCAYLVQADVPPDTGEMRVYPNLEFELADDLPDYRFFLESPADIEEIIIKKGEKKIINSSDRAGAKRFASLLAIPKTNIYEFGENLSSEQLEDLARKIKEKKVAGVTELIRHSFQKDIPVYERTQWSYPTYQIIKNETGIQAIEYKRISPELNSNEKLQINSAYFVITAVVSGVLIALAIIVAGIFLFRKALKKKVK